MLPFLPPLKPLNPLENFRISDFPPSRWWIHQALDQISALFRDDFFTFQIAINNSYIHRPSGHYPPPPAPGNETRPAKVRVMRSSCLEVQCHSWIGFASKAYFARRADIRRRTVGAWGHPRTLVRAPLPFEQCSSSCSCCHSCIGKDATLMNSPKIKTVAPALTFHSDSRPSRVRLYRQGDVYPYSPPIIKAKKKKLT